MKESIVHLWDMGIINVPANIVYEDIWKEGDEKIPPVRLENRTM